MTKGNNSRNGQTLYIAFELSNTKWRLCFGNGQKEYQKLIDSGDLLELSHKIQESIERFKFRKNVRIVSCYEAGRDGFWIHRFLENCGIENLVVDPASIETNRHKRRVKTDRIDARKLMGMLIRHFQGEVGMWSVCRVPTIQQEDNRQMQRELDRLKKDSTRARNRIISFLKTHGIEVKMNKDFLTNLDKATLWDGQALPLGLKQSIIREHEKLCLFVKQTKAIEKQRQEIIKKAENSNKRQSTELQQILSLMLLRGVGPVTAWTFVMEFFGWRDFKNRRQVAALAGLAPTPYDSGNSKLEQGISKAGNKRVRKMAVELAWFWLRFQPQSKLSRWFNRKFAAGGKRLRRVGIVAVARKLLVDLWKYLKFGEVPEGAIFKTV